MRNATLGRNISIEKSSASVTLPNLCRIADVLGVSIHHVIREMPQDVAAAS